VKVVATYSIKGGVGKTSAAVNVAALAAREGLRTVLWDLDPQGAASFLFRVEPKVKGGGKQLLKGKREPLAVMKGTDVEGPRPAAADFSYRHLDIQLDKRRKPLEGPGAGARPARGRLRPRDPRLRAVDLARLGERVQRGRPAARAAHPVDAGGAHARSAARLPGRGPGPVPEVLPFFSMVDRRKKLHKELVATLPGVAAAAIPNASQVELMGLRRAPLVVTAPRNPAALAYAALWEELRAAI
jgi:hypothetical protein